MSKFNELNENINIILTTVINNQNLCKLIYYNDYDPLSQPDIDGYDLLFNQVFPYPFNPTIQNEVGTTLNAMLDSFSIKGNSYKDGIIVFDIICDTASSWKVKGGLRPLFIMNEIDKSFGDQRLVGIGKLQFDRVKRLTVSDKFAGYTLTYKITDFN